MMTLEIDPLLWCAESAWIPSGRLALSKVRSLEITTRANTPQMAIATATTPHRRRKITYRKHAISARFGLIAMTLSVLAR